MTTPYSTTKQISIKASPSRVWEALISPEILRQYMFGTEVLSTWQKGSPVVYKGQWDGQPFEDKGIILENLPERLLKIDYFSVSSGLEDLPNNHSMITYKLTLHEDDSTTLAVTQNNHPTQTAADVAGENWEMTLFQIKTILEK